MNAAEPRANGLPYALAAYLMWGMLPLYFKFLHGVPPLEVVGWRVLFTIPVGLLLIVVLRQFASLRAILTTPRTLAALVLSAVLIATNWLVYVIAIASDHVFAASLGYYVNPLMNVLAGTLFLNERLTRRQWIAVALAGIGVAILAGGALNTLWISLTLALTFCAYGLVRKLTAVDALPGLVVETLVLFVPALGLIAWQAAQPGGTALGDTLQTDLLLAGTGLVTGLPLLLFATAARRMSYSTLGFVQYLAPTMMFLLGLFVFHEPLRPVQLASFMMIWSAIAVFCFDLLRRQRPAPPVEAEEVV